MPVSITAVESFGIIHLDKLTENQTFGAKLKEKS